MGMCYNRARFHMFAGFPNHLDDVRIHRSTVVYKVFVLLESKVPLNSPGLDIP